MSKLEALRVTYETVTLNWKISQIVGAMANGTLTFDAVIQRSLVWDNARKSRLIESVLLGRKIPPLHFIKTDIPSPDGKKNAMIYDCVDGKQRCNALYEFKTNQLALTGVIPELNDMRYEDLEAEDKIYFDSTTLSIVKYENTDDKDIATIMSCLNNGKSLTGIEKSRINAKDMSGISVLSNHPFFLNNLTEKSIASKHNEDLLIKVLLLKDNIVDLSNKQITKFYEEKKFTPDEITEISGEIDNMNIIYGMLNDMKVPKSTLKNLVSRTHLATIIYFCTNVSAAPQLIAKFLIKFFSGKPSISVEYNNACQQGTSHANNVLTRNEEIMDSWNAFLRNETEDTE